MTLQVRVHGPGDVRLDDVAEPAPGPADAVVRVAACGICGSDLHYVHLGGLAGPGPEPMCLGHEVAGIVDEVGSEVHDVAVGDRVILQPRVGDMPSIGNGAPEGGLTPRLLVREADRLLHRVPEGMSLEVAALAEPLAVGMHAVEQSEARPGERVAVFGCGPIGLAAVATLADLGVDSVVAVDLSPTRLAIARELGASVTFDAATDDVWAGLAEAHGTVPFMFGPAPATDAYIEASGAASVIGDVIGHARPGARLSVVALHFAPVPVSFLLVLMKQLTIRGSMEYPARFADAIDLLTRRDLSALVTHRFPLDRVTDAFDLLRTSKDAGKVLVTIDA